MPPRRVMPGLQLEVSSTGEVDARVVRTALALWIELPDASALEILDCAVRAHDGEDLDFQFDVYELQLPHPFAELLRRAFAPDLDPTEVLRATQLVEPTDPQIGSRIDAWDRAILRFAERYGIWAP